MIIHANVGSNTRMKNYTLIILIFVLLIGCKTINPTFLCDNEKAFISFQDFYRSAFDENEPKTPQCNPFLFDSLKSFDQIDSYKNYLCNNNLIDCSGCISLKYLYGHDTIYIPAFEFACDGCMISLNSIRTIHFHLKNDSLSIKDIRAETKISFKTYNDTLASIFSESIGDFCQLMGNRKPYINNKDSLNSWRFFNNSYRRVLVIEISDDTQIVNLKKLIDMAYDLYLQKLHFKIENIYHSEICKLSKTELKAFAKGLFFPITVYKEYPITYIVLHEPNK
jgi:hypothetical protein